MLRHPLRRLIALPLLAVLATLSLSGCVRAHIALAVSQDDLISGEVIVAALSTRDGDPGPELTIPTELADRVRAEPYAADGYVGQRLTISELRFSDMATLTESLTTGQQYRLSFRRSGDLVSMAGSIDLTQLQPERADVQVKIAFPGTINRTNGQQEDGGTISWKPKPAAVTEFSVTAEYSDTSGVSWTRWVALVGGGAIGVALIVLLLALFVHRRNVRQLDAERAQAVQF